MENNSTIGKIYEIYRQHYKKILFFSKILLAIILFIILLYLLERYLLYNIIYSLLLFISHIFHLEKYNIFSIKFESIFLLIYFHILLIRLIVLSIVFIQGGLFKKLLVSEQFNTFIITIHDLIHQTINSLALNKLNEFKYFMNQLDILKKSIENIKIKKSDWKINNYDFENDLNNSCVLYYIYKANNSSENLENLFEALKTLYNNIEKFPALPIYKKIFFPNYEDSLLLMEQYMMNSFITHSVQKININKDFDIYLISPKIENKIGNKILSIFCNQNALCCEFYSISKDNIDYYLHKLNCTIIIWNYKGFGLRKGYTTFSSIDKDVNILSNYIKNNFNKYKIIIHGCSIGGYSSIKLTQKLLNELNDVILISDRTFGDIKSIVHSLNFHEILDIIYAIIFPKWYFKYSNIDNYININHDKKLILFDASDEIIKYNPASLVFNITKRYYNDIIKPKLNIYNKYFSLIMNSPKLKENLKQLAIDCNEENFDNNGRIFIQHLSYFINTIEEFFMFFIIFGFPFNRTKEINPKLDKFKNEYTKIPIIFKQFLDKNKDFIEKEIIDIILAFNFLYTKINLNTEISDEDILNLKYEKNNINIEQNHIKELKKYFGYVHRITCGHNGKLKEYDYTIIKEFLKNNNFI
jgi:hypothetical protein